MNSASSPIGKARAFQLLLLIALVVPWLVFLIIYIVSGGLVLVPLMFFPKVLVAVYPFLFWASDAPQGQALVPFPLNLSLTVGMWLVIGYCFSRSAGAMGRRDACRSAFCWTALVWMATLLLVVLFGAPGYQIPFRT